MAVYTTVNNGKTQFNTSLWTGNNAASRDITEAGTFRPGMVWLKARNYSGRSHYLWQEAEGYGANKELVPNGSVQEGDTSNHNTGANGYVSGTQPTGFTLAEGSSDSDYTNASSYNYVGWTWKGTNSTSNNTDGSITINSSVNSTGKFSVGIYSGNGSAGSTIGHGLGVKPACIVIKVRNTADDWAVWTRADSTSTLRLNSSSAKNDGKYSSFFNSTQPSSSLITLGNDAQVNGNGNSYLMFCWAEVQGYSKFGKYFGNSDSDGAFIYTGFKPAWVVIKRLDSAEDWGMMDNKRSSSNGNNVIDRFLYANSNSTEATTQTPIDLYSNGFKCRNTDGKFNANGGTYSYMAFAENPFVGGDSVPTTAK